VTDDERNTLRAMAEQPQRRCRPESIGSNVDQMEWLEALGCVQRVPTAEVAIYQLTDKGRAEAAH